ncbi:MAG: acylphosphatase [Alteromonadaceae bacterium]|nr:MAG: acylphosphatase [Alteromonadaceae bacterium]
MKTVKFFVGGRVQGVGFRYWVQTHAVTHDVDGYAKNLSDGRVEVLLQGEAYAVSQVSEAVRAGPVMSRVDHVEATDINVASSYQGFVSC